MTRPAGTAIEHEPSDAEPRLIAWLAVGTGTFLVVSPFVLQLLFPQSLHRVVVAGRLAEIPAPRLQLDPPRDLAALRRNEEQRLSGYGLVDRERKTVHIPIDRALSLTLKRGLPGWPKP